MSNRPDDIRYGTTGKPVSGYDVKLEYLRWIEFVSELSKTATGKIQRYKLRS